MEGIMEQVIVERDILKDRILSYDEFMQVLNFLPYASKYWILMALAGVTGARPCELVNLRWEDFDFTDRKNPKVKVRIRKAKTEAIQIKYKAYRRTLQKVVFRPIPLWIAKALDLYACETQKNLSMWLFPKANPMKGPMTTATALAQISKIRQQMFKAEPNRFAWAKEIYKTDIFGNGRERQCHRFSLYSFRKMHCVLYLNMMKEQGDMNSLVATAKHMGHSDIKTTLKYLALAIDDRKNIEQHGFMNKPPKQEQDDEVKLLKTEVAEIKDMLKSILSKIAS